MRKRKKKNGWKLVFVTLITEIILYNIFQRNFHPYWIQPRQRNLLKKFYQLMTDGMNRAGKNPQEKDIMIPWIQSMLKKLKVATIREIKNPISLQMMWVNNRMINILFFICCVTISPFKMITFFNLTFYYLHLIFMTLTGKVLIILIKI